MKRTHSRRRRNVVVASGGLCFLAVVLAIPVLGWSCLSALAQDPDPGPQDSEVQFESSSYTVSEGDGSVYVTVVLGTPSSTTVTVQYQVTGPNYNGETVVYNDVVTFAPGETSKSIELQVEDNSPCVEENLTYTATLSNPNGATLGSQSSTTIYVLDEDS